MELIGCAETSVANNMRCVTSQKSEDLNHNLDVRYYLEAKEVEGHKTYSNCSHEDLAGVAQSI